MGVPYGEDGNLEYEVVKKQIKDYMGACEKYHVYRKGCERKLS